MGKNLDFTQGKIFTPLLKFSIPVFFALCLQAMYGAVDLLIVGQFASSADVSAVSTGSQLLQTITFVITGLAMGTTILLAQKIGAKKGKEAGDIMGSSICFFSCIAIVATIIMLCLSSPLCKLLQAPPEAFDNTVAYVTVCSAGMIFIVAYNLLGSIFRGIGDSKTPLLAVIIACVLNIGGDYLFVAVFKMGASGAALATVISQAISVLICLAVIKKRGLPFTFGKKNIRFSKNIILQVLKFGTPIALQDLLVSISFLVILGIVNSLGLVASAGIGVAEKICMFIMLVPSSYMQSLSAFVGQNIGAGKPDRAKKAMYTGMAISFGVGVVIAYFSFFHGNVLSSIFSADSEVIIAASEYLKAYAIDTMFVAFLFCFGGYFNGCGKTTFTMVQGVIGAFLVRIPVSFFMSKITPVSLFYIGLATPCSTLVQIAICLIYFIYINKKMSALQN